MSSGSHHQADEFNKNTIENLLAALNDKLAEKDLYGDIYVVGGAALILEYGADRRTGDIDCAIQSEPEAIHTAAAEIANEWPELPGDWLNETAAVAHKIPDEPDDAAAISFKGSHLTVRTASAERLIAMKIHAGREVAHRTSPATSTVNWSTAFAIPFTCTLRLTMSASTIAMIPRTTVTAQRASRLVSLARLSA